MELARAYIEGGVGKIPLFGRNGLVRAWTIVDEVDLDELSIFNWNLMNGGYAARNSPMVHGKRYIEVMSRRLLGLVHKDPLEADHINLDKLDNRRCNLRIVTHAQNVQNLPSKGGSSRHRGVSWRSDTKKWRAEATCGEKREIAYFCGEEEAAQFAIEARRRLLPYSMI